MQHLDEGIIHAWIDGELPVDEASRVEAHANSCAACGALVAEARGLVAASSRIVSALDNLPRAQRGVSTNGLPAFGARMTRGRWMTAKLTTAIAATLVIAAGTMMTMRRRDMTFVSDVKYDTAAAAPTPKPTSSPPRAVRAAPRTAIAAAPRVENVAATPAAPSLPAPATDSIAKVVAQVQVDTTQFARSAVPTGRIAGAMTRAGGASGVAEARAASPQKSMVVRSMAAMDAASLPSYVGCYELNESTDVLPKRFALRADSARAGVGGSNELRYVDSTGVVDGRMVDAGWMETGGRAVIRTAGLGEILTILRTGNAILAQSPLGPRTVRVTTCH